jgi:hypothetical protein
MQYRWNHVVYVRKLEWLKINDGIPYVISKNVDWTLLFHVYIIMIRLILCMKGYVGILHEDLTLIIEVSKIISHTPCLWKSMS